MFSCARRQFSHAGVDAAHIVRDFIEVERVRRAPKYGARFLRDLKIFAERLELKNQIVVEVVGLAALAGDAVNVHACERRPGILNEFHSGLFNHLAAGGIADPGILAVDVSARKQPAAEAAMMHQEYPLSIR
jgi:hypothetical protein